MMPIFLSLILSLILGSYAAELREVTFHPDTGLNISQLLEKYGYPFESHSVQTEDGYILGVHRIPHGHGVNNSQINGTRPAALLVHGLLCSSTDFVNGGPNMSLAMQLADEGYDVWLGNVRGNTFSRKHVTLDPDNNSSFWSYSFHEMAYYDIPAKVDYILNVTSLKKIAYVGHSQGTTASFAFLSLRPEYNDKINVVVALSPVVFMSNTSGPIVKLLSDYEFFIDLALQVLNIHEILPLLPIISKVSNEFCNDESPVQELCANVIFFLCGFDSPQLNRTFLTVITSNAPSGSSFMQYKHYLQSFRTGLFRQYDYGIIQNLAIYGQLSPPPYNLSAVTAPTALYYAQNDFFSDVSNVMELIDVLPNVVRDYLVPWELFNHVDFIWAKDVKELVNNDVVDVLNKYK